MKGNAQLFFYEIQMGFLEGGSIRGWWGEGLWAGGPGGLASMRKGVWDKQDGRSHQPEMGKWNSLRNSGKGLLQVSET